MTEAFYLGYPIRADITRLDSGVHILITGGCRSHIGAVSTAESDGAVQTQTFPGHKDQFISEPWAKALAEKTSGRACVVCGIHYDGATKTQIAEILKITDRMLQEILAAL